MNVGDIAVDYGDVGTAFKLDALDVLSYRCAVNPATIKNDMVSFLEQDQIVITANVAIRASICNLHSKKAVVICPGAIADDFALAFYTADSGHHPGC